MKSQNYDINCESCSNKDCFIKKYCSQEWLSIITKSKGILRCNKGQNIILEGSSVMGIYFIYRGKVKITVSGENNKEQIVRLANTGDIFGHRGYEGESYPIGAVAMEDSFICYVNNDVLYDAFLANPIFSISLMMFYSQELRKTEARLKYLAQMTVREKVAFALVYLTQTFKLSTTDNMLNVNITRKEIANIAGTTADQVSREITALDEEKVLTTDGKRIFIHNYKQLQEKVESYYPRDY